MTLWAVVLAGGASRRFGSDKLEVRLGAERLLEASIGGLRPEARLVVVGPARERLGTQGRPITYVREDPPGGGPAAAIVAGLIAVTADRLAAPGDLIVVLPGDTPAAGRAAGVLLAALEGDPARAGVVGTDPDGRLQALQLALTRSAAEQLIAAAGPGRAADGSARALILTLGDQLSHITLGPELTADIDTPGDLAVLTSRRSGRADLRKIGDA